MTTYKGALGAGRAFNELIDSERENDRLRKDNEALAERIVAAEAELGDLRRRWETVPWEAIAAVLVTNRAMAAQYEELVVNAWLAQCAPKESVAAH